MKLSPTQAMALQAYAEALCAVAKAEPVRIYLGEGIWWQPSDSYLEHERRRLAIRKEAPDAN